MKPVCIILAAGASSRFGGDKLAEKVEGKSLLRRAAEAVPKEWFEKVILVSSRPEGAELAADFGVVLVPNPKSEEGVSRSVRLGLEQAGICSGALFMVADQPLLRRESVERLTAEFLRHPEQIVCAAHEGERGNPCIFPSALFSELLALTGDKGGSAVIGNHPELVRLVEVEAAELADVDTPFQLAAIAKWNTPE